MDNYPLFWKERQLNIIIPATILSHTDLSFNQKLILGLDYSFKLKKGFNIMSNKDVGQLLNLHSNIISYCRRQLVNKGFLNKEGKKYTLTDKHKKIQVDDIRSILLPYQVYNHDNIITGAKLLWGEYNSISKGENEYFAKRAYTAKRLNASEEIITSWTKRLFENNLLFAYYHKTGYCISQKVVVTSSVN